MPGRTPNLNYQNLEDRVQLLIHEADIARKWIGELRTRARAAANRARDLDRPDTAKDLEKMAGELERALVPLESFEDRIADASASGRNVVLQRRRQRRRKGRAA